jgi:hypothetical protein
MREGTERKGKGGPMAEARGAEDRGKARRDVHSDAAQTGTLTIQRWEPSTGC